MPRPRAVAFFQVGGAVGGAEALRLLHGDYGLDYVRRQPLPVVTTLLLAALRQREEGQAWQLWLALYPYMVVPSPYTREGAPLLKFVPFSQFGRAPAPAVESQPELTADQIIARGEAAKARHQQRSPAS